MPLSKENELAHRTIGFAIEIHKAIGPGLNTEIYKTCLGLEMESNHLAFSTDLLVPVNFKNRVFDNALKADIVIEDSVAVLIDSSDAISDHKVLTLLRLIQAKNYKLGLIINFNYTLMKNGIRRVTNNKLLESLGSMKSDI